MIENHPLRLDLNFDLSPMLCQNQMGFMSGFDVYFCSCVCYRTRVPIDNWITHWIFLFAFCVLFCTASCILVFDWLCALIYMLSRYLSFSVYAETRNFSFHVISYLHFWLDYVTSFDDHSAHLFDHWPHWIWQWTICNAAAPTFVVHEVSCLLVYVSWSCSIPIPYVLLGTKLIMSWSLWCWYLWMVLFWQQCAMCVYYYFTFCYFYVMLSESRALGFSLNMNHELVRDCLTVCRVECLK